MQDRDFVLNLIDRAKAAGCSALVLTLDLQILGQRHKDLRNGLSAPPRFTPKHHLADGDAALLVPRHARHASAAPSATSSATPRASGTSPRSPPGPPSSSTRSCPGRISSGSSERWGGKLILKGILDEEDARMALDSGADAIIVSNHGGRQLDGAPSSISHAARIVDAVGDRMEVHLDGGIRSGQDVLKALCLGAKGTYIGRPFLYGLGAGGKAGVRQDAGDHPQGARCHHGALRRARREEPVAQQSPQGYLKALQAPSKPCRTFTALTPSASTA
jgi:L-lactate dehydrogenase (cytochrome)